MWFSFVVIPLLEGWHLALHTALLCELGAGSVPGRGLHCICMAGIRPPSTAMGR